MTLTDFTERIPAEAKATITEATLRIWHCIYSHLTEHGQTDRFDAELDKAIRAALDKWVSDATVQRHLKRMATAGLLQPHRIVVRYTEFGRVWLPFGRMFNNDGPPPGAFIRYTLPGMKPTLENKKEDDDESTTKA